MEGALKSDLAPTKQMVVGIHSMGYGNLHLLLLLHVKIISSVGNQIFQLFSIFAMVRLTEQAIPLQVVVVEEENDRLAKFLINKVNLIKPTF